LQPRNVRLLGLHNVEFVQADIENLPQASCRRNTTLSRNARHGLVDDSWRFRRIIR
jgi:hypothetical protein